MIVNIKEAYTDRVPLKQIVLAHKLRPTNPVKEINEELYKEVKMSLNKFFDEISLDDHVLYPSGNVMNVGKIFAIDNKKEIAIITSDKDDAASLQLQDGGFIKNYNAEIISSRTV